MNIRGERHNKRHQLVDVVPLSTPYVMFIDPSSRCNFKCSFCPSNNTRDEGMKKGLMSEETFDRVVAGMEEFPEKIKVVELYCIGEPLINKNISSMIKTLKYVKKVSEKVRLTTNGSYLTHELSQNLVESGLDYMKISIEALDSAGYRDICGVDIDFEHLVEEIRYLYTVSRGKMELGIKIVDAALRGEEDMRNFLNIFMPISDCAFVEKLQSIWAEFNGEFVDGGMDVSKIDYYTLHNSRHKICAYPLTHMLVHSNGDIGVCCMDWKHGTVYGNVHTMSLYDAWNSAHLRQFRLTHLAGKRAAIPFCCHCTQVSNDDVDRDAETIIDKL